MKKFRRTPWRFQQTFQTPLKALPAFVSAVLTAHEGIGSATLTIDEVVFQPTALESLLSQHGLPSNLPRDTSILAENVNELHSLLVAALSEWVDFLVVPSPKSFVFYADHDEYATFFTANQSKLSTLKDALIKHGFTAVKNYTRTL